MYTELHYNATIPAPNGLVVDTLHYMISGVVGSAWPEDRTPDHPLFRTERWRFMLNSDSYYFPAKTHSQLKFDDIIEGWRLGVRCNLKNYDGEIEHFVDWLAPHIEENGTLLGFYRYEEDREPTLIYAPVRG